MVKRSTILLFMGQPLFYQLDLVFTWFRVKLYILTFIVEIFAGSSSLEVNCSKWTKTLIKEDIAVHSLAWLHEAGLILADVLLIEYKRQLWRLKGWLVTRHTMLMLACFFPPLHFFIQLPISPFIDIYLITDFF